MIERIAPGAVPTVAIVDAAVRAFMGHHAPTQPQPQPQSTPHPPFQPSTSQTRPPFRVYARADVRFPAYSIGPSSKIRSKSVAPST